MSVYKKFTKDVSLVSVVHILMVVKGLIFLPLITKMLGVFSYGIWVQLLVTASFIAPWVKLGLTNSLIRYLSSEKNKEEIKEGIYSTLFSITVISIFIFLLFLLFLKPISGFFQAPALFIILLPLIILFECINSAILTIFQAFLKIAKYSFFTISASIGEILLVILSVYLGYGLTGAVFSLLFIRIIIFIFLFVDIYRTIGFKIPKFNLFKKYLTFGLPTLLSNISYLVVTSADKYILGFFLGTLYVGYYAPAYSLGNLITFFIIPISFVLFPSLSKLYDENRIQEVKTKLRYSLKYFLIVAIPAAFGMSVLMKEILKIFSTETIALNSFFITPFIASSIVLYGITDIFSQTLTLAKKTKIVGLIWAGAAVLNITSNFILIPRLGILGAAVATLISYAFGFLLIWYFSFKEFSFTIDWFEIIKIILCSGFMSLIVWQINPSGIFTVIATIAIGIVCYVLFIIGTKVFSKKEFIFLKGLINDKL